MSSVDRGEVLTKLTDYVRRELLDGDPGGDLTTRTPLLEWGVLKSLETARLVGYLRTEFGVRVPSSSMVGDNFRDIERIADLVTSLSVRS
ncbi:phosphopantetheine-binding protein [Saccharopolyspora rosea]|uniref:Phosphopantetheine-binding protein n=1 Tax=Saccharopolyspora rosea TaxID=524884 RepID=A0ABW3FWF7_9PSEU|nr:phosphopantetheine-binding protein [Saccharopolyspora rosea]